MPKINHKFILHTTFHHHTKSSVLFSAEEVLTLNSVPFKTKRKNFLYSNEETVYLVLITYQKQFFKFHDWWHIIKCSSLILTLRHLVSCRFIQVYFLSVFYSLKMVTKNSHAKNVVSLVIRAVFLRYCCYDFLFCDDDEDDEDDDDDDDVLNRWPTKMCWNYFQPVHYRRFSRPYIPTHCGFEPVQN